MLIYVFLVYSCGLNHFMLVYLYSHTYNIPGENRIVPKYYLDIITHNIGVASMKFQ